MGWEPRRISRMIAVIMAFSIWLYIIMFFHWIGDFICQNRWMATNKCKRWDALSLHVLIYTLVVTFGGIVLPLIVAIAAADTP